MWDSTPRHLLLCCGFIVFQPVTLHTMLRKESFNQVAKAHVTSDMWLGPVEERICLFLIRAKAITAEAISESTQVTFTVSNHFPTPSGCDSRAQMHLCQNHVTPFTHFSPPLASWVGVRQREGRHLHHSNGHVTSLYLKSFLN